MSSLEMYRTLIILMTSFSISKETIEYEVH
jgi:hypothetical protein